MPEAVPGESWPEHVLCNGHDLLDGGDAVLFDVQYGGQTMLGFAVRFQGQVVAYLNRCAHVPSEMDWRPGRFFDETKQWLMCATHGAVYQPLDGLCVGGPCRGKSLIPVTVREADGLVYWQEAHNLKAVVF